MDVKDIRQNFNVELVSPLEFIQENNMKIIFNIFTFSFTMPLYADDHSNEQSFPVCI